MPMPHSDHGILKATSEGHGTAQHGMCELTLAIERRHVGDLPAFGFFRLSWSSMKVVIRTKPISDAGGQRVKLLD
jgi:hypothetical protein